MANPNASHRNHYIPCFYTKRWATNASHELVEFWRPHKEVVARWKSPAAVGFKNDLYTLTGLIEGQQTLLEDVVFKEIDQKSSDVLDHVEANPRGPYTQDQISDFTRMILAFLHRTPDRIQAVVANFLAEAEPAFQRYMADIKSGSVPPLTAGFTHDQVLNAWRRRITTADWGNLLVRLLDSDFLGPRIARMVWTIRFLPHAKYDLLTGDKPLIGTNGFAQEYGHIVLPLGPRSLFLATNNSQTTDNILSSTDDQLSRKINERIAQQAKVYVYGTDKSQLPFVEKRLGYGENLTLQLWTDKTRASSRLRRGDSGR